MGKTPIYVFGDEVNREVAVVAGATGYVSGSGGAWRVALADIFLQHGQEGAVLMEYCSDELDLEIRKHARATGSTFHGTFTPHNVEIAVKSFARDPGAIAYPEGVPFVVITQVSPPRYDGIELTRSLREVERQKGVE